MKPFIWIIILSACLVTGYFAVDNYYSPKLIGNWTAVFQKDLSVDNRWVAQRIELNFQPDGTFIYQITSSYRGQTVTTFEGSSGTMTEKSNNTRQKKIRGTYFYHWFHVYVQFTPPRYSSTDDFDPFHLDRFSQDPQTNKPVLKLSARVDFIGDFIALQGSPSKEAINFGKDGNDTYNDFILEQHAESYPTAIRRSRSRPFRVIRSGQ